MPQLALHTRQLTQIENDHVQSAPTAGQQMEAASVQAKYPLAVPRPTEVTFGYNCHGLTFAARRTEIFSSSEVRRILQEDGYVRLGNLSDVVAGDIVLYIGDDGGIEHSGLVVECPALLPKIPRVLSKWGLGREFIHPFNYCPYPLVFEFHRLVR